MIRDVRASDWAFLKALHEAHGFGDEFLTTADLLTGKVFVDHTDTPRMFIGARMIAEMVMLVDPEWNTPGVRKAVFNHLYEQTERDLGRLGVKQGVAWIADKVWKSFGRRLRREFGWTESKLHNLVGQVRVHVDQ